MVEPGERGHHHVELRPQQAARRHRPALGRAEQPRAAARAWPRRTRRRAGSIISWIVSADHVHLPSARLGDLQVERHHRRGGMAHRARAQHLELGLGPGRRPGRAATARRVHLDCALMRERRLAQAVEEASDGVADARAARDALPRRLDRACQLVTAVDRRDHVRGRVRQTVDDQPLDVRLEIGQHRVARDAICSRWRSAARSRSRRPGSGTSPPRSRPIVDSMKNASPIGIWKLAHSVLGQLEVLEPQRARAGRAVLRSPRAQRPAALTRRTRSGARPG